MLPLTTALSLSLARYGPAPQPRQFFDPTPTPNRCRWGQACWPTPTQLEDFGASLSGGPRTLVYNGTGNPRPCAVPIYSPGDQPLYGYRQKSLPKVVANASENGGCFATPGEERANCFYALRNNPLESWQPSIVTFALNGADVQAAVAFAARHNLCVSVLGTGHDFMNRHSCDGGILIRTTLLKGATFTADKRAVTLGAGMTFSEIAKETEAAGRLVSQGWGITVGVAGWSLGGGHGPFANALGMGADNIVSAEIVTADGELVNASASENADLWWALRGGGGSAWGVLVSLTVRAHPLPSAGIQVGYIAWAGNACAAGLAARDELIDGYMAFSQSADQSVSDLSFMAQQASAAPGDCGGNWTIFFEGVCLGTSEGCAKVAKSFTDLQPEHKTLDSGAIFKSQWERATSYPLEPITPVPWTGPSETRVGGVASVLVPREQVASGTLAKVTKETLNGCGASSTSCEIQFYHDITGNNGAPRAANVSMPPSMRDALFHVVTPSDSKTVAAFYELGENSYAGESAYAMEAWQERTWGSSYGRLLQIKQKRDPKNLFWCRHCVGSDLAVG
jgi:ribonuclease T2